MGALLAILAAVAVVFVAVSLVNAARRKMRARLAEQLPKEWWR